WLKVAPSLFFVEVLRPDGLPVKPGEAGIIAITAMTNRAMPLIRYRLGDVGRFMMNDLGRDGDSLHLVVEGRVNESLFVDSRLVTTREIYEALARVPNLGYFQLTEQLSDRIDLCVVPSRNSTLLEADAVDALTELLGDAYSIKARKVPS